MQMDYNKLTEIISSDPGQRRIPDLARPEALAGAHEQLLKSKRVLLISGFYIGRLKAFETDGPLGTLALAYALNEAGILPIIATAEDALPIFAAGMSALSLDIPLLGYPAGQAPDLDELHRLRPDTIVTIETCGRTAGGQYFNADGTDVSDQTVHFDEWLLAAPGLGIASIAVGDGGNELGFGSHFEAAATLLGPAQRIVCATPADILLACGVSNWGGYALADLVTAAHDPSRALTEEALLAALKAMVAAGAVDGVSGLRTETVDGLPLEAELDIFRRIRETLELKARG